QPHPTDGGHASPPRPRVTERTNSVTLSYAEPDTWRRPLSNRDRPGKLVCVRLREWDPATAPAEEIAGWLDLYNDVMSADLPADPRWNDDQLREYLVVTMPDERRTWWLIQDDDGTVLGYAGLLVLSDLGVLELYVRPGVRGTGVGRALLRAVADQAAT